MDKKIGNWVVLKKTNPMEADIIKGKLNSSGIDVRLFQESYGKLVGFTVDGMGEVTIFVPEKNLNEAREILNES